MIWAKCSHQNTATVVNGYQFGYVPNMAHNLLVMGDPEKNQCCSPTMEWS